LGHLTEPSFGPIQLTTRVAEHGCIEYSVAPLIIQHGCYGSHLSRLKISGIASQFVIENSRIAIEKTPPLAKLRYVYFCRFFFMQL
jgi:hypothetical protein